MTRLQLDYAAYLENRRHDLADEAISQARNDEVARSNRAQEQLSARSIANSEQVTANQIRQAEANIRQADRSLDLKASQQNWQQQLDKFNANLASQKNMIAKDTLALDKDKFSTSKEQWNSEYALRRKNYDLAVKQFKLDKTDKTWKNVLATSKEVRAWIEPAAQVVSAASKAIVAATKQKK